MLADPPGPLGRYPGRLKAGLLEPIPGPGAGVGLPVAHPTLASLLKQAGYATAMFGKWHCGYLPDYGPVKSGWDTFFGNLGGAVDYFSKISGSGETDLYEGEVRTESLEYYTRTVSERAAAFIRANSGGPWLLNLNYTARTGPGRAPATGPSATISPGASPRARRRGRSWRTTTAAR